MVVISFRSTWKNTFASLAIANHSNHICHSEADPGWAEETPYVMPHAARDVTITEVASTATKINVSRMKPVTSGIDFKFKQHAIL